MGMDAREYHEETKHTPARVRSVPGLDFDNQPIPYKIYEDRPRVALADRIRLAAIPALAAIADATGTGPRAIPSLGELTQLCWLSGGITKTLSIGGRNHPFRAAACTGALYHIDLYPIVGKTTGIEAGVYHFDPRSLALDTLRAGDYRGCIAAAAGGIDDIATAPVSFVLTSTWWRNAWKYRERTYRHAFWDAGTIIANLLAVARSIDLPTRVVTGFADDQVADLLGLETATEAPIAIVPLGTDDPVPAPPPLDPIDPDTRPLSPDPKVYDTITDVYDQSTLSTATAVTAWRNQAPTDPIGTQGPGPGDSVALDPAPPPTAATTPLARTIRRRGSAREYTRTPIGFRELSTILDYATRGLPIDIGPTTRLAFNDVYVIANAIDDLPAGTYQYHASSGDLEQLRAGEFRGKAGHLALDQQLGADAAVCVYLLTDLDTVIDRLGNRGYRVAQLEAAVTAGRLYLAAYAHDGIGATGLTFYDDAVTDFFSPRAADQTPMFLWTMGQPA